MIGCAKFSAIPATVQSGSLLSAAWGLGPSPVHMGQGASQVYTWGSLYTPSESIKTPEASTRKYFYAEHRWAHRGTQPVALLIPQNRFLVSLFLHSCANRSSHAVRCDPAEGTCAMFCSDKPVNLLFAEREVKTIFNFSIVWTHFWQCPCLLLAVAEEMEMMMVMMMMKWFMMQAAGGRRGPADSRHVFTPITSKYRYRDADTEIQI